MRTRGIKQVHVVEFSRDDKQSSVQRPRPLRLQGCLAPGGGGDGAGGWARPGTGPLRCAGRQPTARRPVARQPRAGRPANDDADAAANDADADDDADADADEAEV